MQNNSLTLFAAAVLLVTGCQTESNPLDDPVTATSRKKDLRSQAPEILKEPNYEGTPHYALLVFGDDAEQQKWLIVDNETVYVDRNGDGDLTATDESVAIDELATSQLTVGGTGEYKRMNIFDLGSVAGNNLELHVWVRDEDFQPRTARDIKRASELMKNGWVNSTLWRYIPGSDQRRAQIPVIFCPRPEDAQISHIDGPLTFDLKWGNRQKLERSGKDIFDIHIGTPGIATRNNPYSPFSNLTVEEVPPHVVPTAIMTFESKSKPGEPIELTVELDRRC